MKFEVPIWLWGAPVAVGLAVGLLVWAQRRRRAALSAAIRSALLPDLIASFDPRRRWLKHGLFVLGMVLLLVALARPQAGHETTVLDRTGIDLLVAVDVSRSMLAVDVDGTNRLEAARAAVRHLLHRLAGDRVGLIAFAGEPFLASPLTRDATAASRAVDALGPSLVSEPGSDLAKAIALARESFERAGEGPRLLLLVSDGEQLQGEALAAARTAASAGLRIHCAGVGSVSGAGIPQATGAGAGQLRNAFGREVRSRLDERLLREAATAGRGEYVRLTGRDSRALVGWFDRAGAGLPRVTERRELGDPQERFQWPLTLALVLLASERFIGERRRPVKGKLTGMAAVMLASGSLWMAECQAAEHAPVNQAPLPSADTPVTGLAWAAYNRGVTAYAARQFEKADAIWLELLNRPLPRALHAPTWFQVGNAEFRLGEPLVDSAPEQAADAWRRSREAYRTALSIRSSHDGARRNLELVNGHLAGLTRRLGNELAARSEQEGLDAAITALQAATEYLREASQLAPRDPQVAADQARVTQRWRERLRERADRAERQGDEHAGKEDSWNAAHAERAYRDALLDLAAAEREGSKGTPVSSPPARSSRPGEAPLGQTPGAQFDRELREAWDRVAAKLAQLLTWMGQQEQQAGAATSPVDPEEAFQHYEQALGHYVAAREIDPSSATARQGEAEVRLAMEQLHVQQGRDELQQGIVASDANVRLAAQELASALAHGEAALQLNAANFEAAKIADEARRRLPDLLARLGQIQQKAGARAEAESAAAALPYYEEAGLSYQDALQLSPQHDRAKTGLEQVEERLAALRRQIAQEAAQRDPGAQSAPGEGRSLQQLLGEVRNPWRDREQELERQRQPGVNQASPRKPYPDW